MQISIVTDEISSDIDTALEVIAWWGVHTCEIRSVGFERFPEVSRYWQRRIPVLLKEHGVTVGALSPGLFSHDWPSETAPIYSKRMDFTRVMKTDEDERTLDHHVNVLLPSTIEWGKRFGASTIICFSWGRGDHTLESTATDEMIQVLRHAAGKVGEAGMQLVMEVSEPSERPADIARRVNHPAFGINWDPANAYDGGEDVCYPDGFEQVRPWIRHVHFKDARTLENGKRAWLLDGVIDWRGALTTLKEDGFDGLLTVETHFRPKVKGTYALLQRLRSLLEEIDWQPGEA